MELRSSFLFVSQNKYGSDACSTKKLVIEIIQNPVDSENLLLIFLTFLNPLSTYKKITYLMHDKNLPHSIRNLVSVYKKMVI